MSSCAITFLSPRKQAAFKRANAALIAAEGPFAAGSLPIRRATRRLASASRLARSV